MTRSGSLRSLLTTVRGRRGEAGVRRRRCELEHLEDRRLPSVGNLDLGFGNAGRVLTNLGSGAVRVGAAAQQPDGKIVVAATAPNGGTTDFAVLRYLDNGSLDPAFGNGGVVLTDFGPGDDTARALVLQPDGKIVVAGSASNGTDLDIALARYNLDGSPDLSFARAGRTTLRLSLGDERANAVVIQDNGQIVLAGQAPGTGLAPGSGQDMVLARINADGSPDFTFGLGGVLRVDFAGREDEANALALRPGGGFVLAGSALRDHAGRVDRDFALAFVTAQGQLDPTRGTQGLTALDFGVGDDVATGVVLQGSQVLAGGTATDGQFRFFALARLSLDGATLDPTFGTATTRVGPPGTVTTALGPRDDRGSALALQPNGRIVLAGTALIDHDAGLLRDVETDRDFAVARYDPSGRPDPTFGVNGQVTTRVSTGDDLGQTLVVQPDGKLVVVGSSGNGSTLALARYQADIRPIAVDDEVRRAATSTVERNDVLVSLLANDFDTDGDPLRVTGVTTPSGVFVAAGQAQDTPDGRVTVTDSTLTFRPNPGASGDFRFTYAVNDGWLTSPAAAVSITVLSPDVRQPGDLDPRFGATARATFGDIRAVDRANALAVRDNGKSILAGGQTDFLANQRFELLQLNANGSLDAAFGNSPGSPGFTLFDFGAGAEAANAVAVQNDGRVVAAGFTERNGTRDFALLRLNTNGTPDAGFGNGGTVVTDLGGFEEIRAVALQADGRILVAGVASGVNGTDFLLARYLTNGQLDATFGSGGLVRTDFSGGDDAAHALVLLGSGQIVVAGSASNGTDLDFAVARYLANGAPDTTLAGTGRVRVDFGQGDDVARALGVRGNGTVVAAGSAGNGTDEDIALARILANGAPDNGFGGDGRVTTSPGPGQDRANALALLPGGKVVVFGSSEQDNGGTGGRNRDAVLVRYLANGNLDPGMDGDGILTLAEPGQESVNAVAVLGDGKFLTAGGDTVFGEDVAKIAVTRFNADGTPDNRAFADVGRGAALVSFGPGNDSANALAVQADGSLILAGSAGASPFTLSGEGEFFALTRLQSGVGRRDPAFGNAGRVVTDVTPFLEAALAVAVQPDGKVVAAGFADREPDGFGRDFALVRYNPDGSLDPTFNKTGIVVNDFFRQQDTLQGIALQPDGKIVAVGMTAPADAPDFLSLVLLRFNPDGTYDTAFGLDGTVVTDFGTGLAVGRAVLVLPDGRIIVTGAAFNGSDFDFLLAAYLADGSPDFSFGDQEGFTLTDLGQTNDIARALAFQDVAGGRILVGGSADDGSGSDFALARYTLDGFLDSAFFDPDPGRTGPPSPLGTIRTDFNSGADEIRGLAVQADGKIVAGGGTSNDGNPDFAAARYLPDGALDETFGDQGRRRVNLDNEIASAVGLGPQGAIVLAGTLTNSITNKSVQFVEQFFSEPRNAPPPSAQPDVASAAADVPVDIPVLANDFQAAGATLQVTAVTQGVNGRVRILADGTLRYTPEEGFTGTDRFTYTVSDGTQTSVGTVEVTVVAPPDVGTVLDSGSGLVVGQRFLALSSATAAGTFTGSLGNPVAPGTGTFLQLTTGDTRVAVDNRDSGVNNGTRLRGAFDVTILELTLNVPAGANYLTFDLAFLTNEYQLVNVRPFNDTVIAELDRTTWSVDPVTGAVTAPDNFAVAPAGQENLGARGMFFADRRLVTQTGTFYNAGTPFLQAGTPITPGLHRLYLSVFDVGDPQIDTAVFVNNLAARTVPEALRTPSAQQPPIARPDLLPLPGGPGNLDVLLNDLDLDGQPFTLVSVTAPARGQAVIDPATNTVRYTPPAGGAAADTFTYTIGDGRGGTSTTTVTLLALLTDTDRASRPPSDPPVSAATTNLAADFNNVAPGSDPVALTVGNYSANPVGVTAQGLENRFDGTRFFDLQALDSDTGDRVVLVVDNALTDGKLFYFDGAAFAPIRISRLPGQVTLGDGTVVALNGVDLDPIRLPGNRYLVVLDATSQPRVTGLNGTVIVEAVRVPAPGGGISTPPPSVGNVSSNVSPGPSRFNPPSTPTTPPVSPTPPTGPSNSPPIVSNTPTGIDAGTFQTATRNVGFRRNNERTLAFSAAQSGQGTQGRTVLPPTPTGGTDDAPDDALLAALLGDDPYLVYLLGGEEALHLWLQRFPAKEAKGEPQRVVPAATPGQEASPPPKPNRDEQPEPPQVEEEYFEELARAAFWNEPRTEDPEEADAGVEPIPAALLLGAALAIPVSRRYRRERHRLLVEEIA